MRFFLLFLLGAFFMNGAYAQPFSVTSTAFIEGNTVPVEYTCDGSDHSPPLAWNGAPEKTKTFAIICADPDAPAGTWYHWVIYNIPGHIHELAENEVPAGSVEGKTSWGRNHYNGPCPPKGNPHRYIFTVYALDTQLPSFHLDAQGLEKAMDGHILASGQLKGLYGR